MRAEKVKECYKGLKSVINVSLKECYIVSAAGTNYCPPQQFVC